MVHQGSLAFERPWALETAEVFLGLDDFIALLHRVLAFQLVRPCRKLVAALFAGVVFYAFMNHPNVIS